MLLLHVALVFAELKNTVEFLRSAPVVPASSPFDQGELVGQIVALAGAGLFGLIGLPWVPLNIYGLIAGRRWAPAILPQQCR